MIAFGGTEVYELEGTSTLSVIYIYIYNIYIYIYIYIYNVIQQEQF